MRGDADFRSQISDPKRPTPQKIRQENRFQISDPRSQIPDGPEIGRGRADFRFLIPDFRWPLRRNIVGKPAENRFQNEQNTSQHSTSDFCKAQVSDFRLQNAVRAPETSGTDFGFQKTENKGLELDFKGVKISDSRFRSGAARCGMFSADFRFQNSRLPGAQACLVSQCHISESTNQVPYAKKYR